ncbi:GAF sensor protein [mine drainage metagenome]|uniref:GAF sensor protein n=1 Tax=mine drainage metagenome TaxID=410659 RepID=T0ZXD9_9ZZZZ
MAIHPRQVTPSLLHIDSILGRLAGADALREVVRFLRMEFPQYGWVGVYRKVGAELRLVAWEGPAPTEHVRISIDRGLCGQAVRENRSVVADDVTTSPGYLACFRDTRSEIVVPIRRDGEPIGEIDIDGQTVGAFDDSDRRFLEEVAGRLTGAVEASPDEPVEAP